MTTIDHFDGEHRFLSNFFPCPPGRVWLHFGLCGRYDHWFPTVEHAYQASKTNDVGERDTVRLALSPGLAKRLGRELTIDEPRWNLIKKDVMLWLLQQKFSHPPLGEMLLATGDAHLIEGNTWGDRYWGVCDGEGQNHLGKLLELVRFRLRNPKMFP